VIMSAICESFRQEILEGIHQPGDIYKIALIKSGQARNFGKDLTNYSDLGSDEVEDGNGYTSGGQELQGFTCGLSEERLFDRPTGGGRAWMDWTTNPVWGAATISAEGFLIYNETRGGKAIGVYAFGTTISTGGVFEVNAPRRPRENPRGGPATEFYRRDDRDRHDRQPFDWL
jgi:hypothetical protein